MRRRKKKIIRFVAVCQFIPSVCVCQVHLTESNCHGKKKEKRKKKLNDYKNVLTFLWQHRCTTFNISKVPAAMCLSMSIETVKS